jgi:chromosome segregation ATPase
MTKELDAEIKAKKAELEKLEKRIEEAKAFLERIQLEGKAFTEMWNAIARIEERPVGSGDITELKARLTELEKKYKSKPKPKGE